MNTYLYRAIATNDIPDECGFELWFAGDSIGRQSGYLSRSSAVEAGERYAQGHYTIVRSLPVVFEDAA